MKLIYTLFFLIFALGAFAQWQDDFSDGDFTNSPTWQGDTDNFTVNADFELQLNDEDASQSTSQLSTLVALGGQITWEFSVRLDFSPSTSNFAKVYLLSNLGDLTNSLNGYYIKVGGISGAEDAIELYKQTDNIDELLISGQAGAVGTQPVLASIRVVRDGTGNWELLVDYAGGNDFMLEGTAMDDSHLLGSYIGVVCQYTSTRKDKIFFDDFFVNTDFEDNQTPQLLNAIPISNFEIDLLFDEPLDINSIDSNYFDIDNGLRVLAVNLDMDNSNLVHLTLDKAMTSNETYTVTVNGVKDLFGNIVSNETASYVYYEVEAALTGDIVINELLFNPYTNGVDFIELYNNSDKIFNINELWLENTSKTDEGSKPITEDYLLFPNEYVALSADPMDISNRYIIENPTALLFSTLPAFNNDEGNVTLFRLDDEGNMLTLDVFDYSEDYHYTFLDDVNGVSLERINPDANTQSASNWHSASSTVGFATPTYKNSQFFRDSSISSNILSIPEVTFSPDGDSFKDFLLINYATDQAGYTANVKIYNSVGRLVKNLVNGESLSNEGSIKWDGDTDDGNRAKMGIYIIWAEIFNPNGQVEYFKENCVVAYRLE